jgi:tripartite-type tricarboxylate transporter receptor subunit TctC
MLLPHSMREWLPEGHLAYFINDTVASLDLQAFHARYSAGGSRNQPFHPAMMVKALAVTTPTRSPMLPDVPTLREQGIDLDWTGFIALYGPAHLPANVRTKIQADVATVLKRATIQSRLFAAGMDASTMTPKELDVWLDNVRKRIHGVMSTPGFSLD